MKKALFNYKNILFAFVFISIQCYSQKNIHTRFNTIDFSILEDIVLLSKDSLLVNNEQDIYFNEKLFHYYSPKDNKKVIPYGYKMAYPFVGKTALVKYNDSWGLIDKNGQFVYYSYEPNEVKLSSYEKYVIFNNGTQVIYSMDDGKERSGFIYCAEPAASDFQIIQNPSTNKYRFIKRKNKEDVFKTEVDSIIPQTDRMYYESVSSPNLLILKKNNKYGLYLTNATELKKTQYKNAKFLGDYAMLYDGKKWIYALRKDNKYSEIISSNIECISPGYQENIVGVFINDKKRYNLLKTNGDVLSQDFEYISPSATYAIDGNSVYLFDNKGDFHLFFTK